MAKKRKYKRVSKDPILDIINSFLLHIILSPYYLFKGIIHLLKYLFRKSKKLTKKTIIKKNRKKASLSYKKFKILKTIDGDYDDFENDIKNSDSKIGVILGARGTGKTAFGVKFLENMHLNSKKKIFAIGFSASEMPYFIEVVDNISKIKNNSFVLIDEGGILFSSRNSMSGANKFLSELILIARHKNLSILFISQNSSNIEINVLRQADYLVLKPSSLLQKDFERKIIKNIYEGVASDFKKLKSDKGLTYIYSDKFKGFVSNPLPTFWKENISKSFK